LSFIKPGGKGAMLLWPLFGSLNQLLAGLALGVVTIYLYVKKKNILYTLIPMIFILTMTIWAMLENLIQFFQKKEFLLVCLSIIILLLTGWLIISGLYSFYKSRKSSNT
jgi:carbon starvation protein